MRRLLSFFCAVILTLGLSGCSSLPQNAGDNYDVKTEDSIDKKVSVELVVSTSSSTDEQKIISDLAKGFKQYYPNVTVKVDPMSGEIYDTIMGYYRANKMPDIFLAESFTMLTLGKAGVLLNLDPYIKAETQKDLFDVSDYYESFWRLGQDSFDGKQWMVPRAADQVVIHYNKLKLQEADVDMSKVKNGWTWDDFLSILHTMREYWDGHKMSNRYLVDGYLNWEANYNAIFRSCGVEYFSDGRVAIDSDATREALNIIKTLVDNRYVGKFSGASQANFEGGQGAFLIHSRAASLLREKLSEAYKTEIANGTYTIDDIYDVVTFPLIGDNPKVGAGVAGYCVSGSSKNRDYAWQFLKFMLSREGQNIIAESGANYPSIRKDMADPFAEGVSWGKGFENMNLSAYTWAAQPENDYICATEFILERPAVATDLMVEIESMITSYSDHGSKVGENAAKAKLNSVIKDCAEALQYWAYDDVI